MMKIDKWFNVVAAVLTILFAVALLAYNPQGLLPLIAGSLAIAVVILVVVWLIGRK
jgi:hypothetical protein